MADTKISALTGATTPLDGTELVPVVQSSTTKKATIANIQAATVSAGTANAVQYLNGSKAPTTSSRLTFDGAEIFKNSGGTVQYNDISGSAAACTRMSAGGTLGTDSLDVFQNGAGGYLVNRAGTPLNIGTNNTNDHVVISTSGNVTVNTGNLVQGTAAKGFNFTANTPAAGMTSQLLNWYEEGTWTASLTTDATGPTTPVTSTGRYTRVGRLVTVSCSFSNVSTAGASGNIVVDGLPFTVGSNENYGVAVSYNMGLTSLMSRSSTGTTKIAIISGTTSIAAPVSAGTSQYLLMQITYSI